MRLRIVVTVAAAGLLAACASSNPGPEEPAPAASVSAGPEGTLLRVGEVQEGVITEADPHWGDNGRFHLYRFRANEGDRFTLRMTSADFDTYLVIGDRPSGVFSPIVTDDDSGGDLDARARFVAPASGTYWVLAQAYAYDGLGSYVLALEETPAPRPALAVPLTVGSSAEGELSLDDAVDEFDEKNYDLYTFEGVAGRRYAITLASEDFDTYLVVGRMVDAAFEQLDYNDDNSDGTDSRIVFTPYESGTYSIHATSFQPEGTGAYTIRVAELAAPGPVTVTTLTLGQPRRGALDENDQISDDGGYYDVYRFRGRQGQRISISMSSDDLDSFVQLGEAADEFYDDYSDDDGGGGVNARLITTLWTDGEYEVRAGSYYPDDTGDYTIEVAELPESGPADVRPIELGQTIEGELDPSDASMDDESFYDIYTFRANAGDRVSITLRSDAFDSYLAFGRWRNDDLEVTASDDDSGGGLEGLDAQIQLTIESTGTWAIRVNSLGAMEFGDYRLTLEEQ